MDSFVINVGADRLGDIVAIALGFSHLAEVFLLVADQVFGASNDTRALNALDRWSNQGSRQVRIGAESFLWTLSDPDIECELADLPSFFRPQEIYPRGRKQDRVEHQHLYPGVLRPWLHLEAGPDCGPTSRPRSCQQRKPRHNHLGFLSMQYNSLWVAELTKSHTQRTILCAETGEAKARNRAGVADASLGFPAGKEISL